MKLKDKKIAFGLTNVYYAFPNTIREIKNIIFEGGEVIPIMPIDTYKADNQYYDVSSFIKDIETITNKKIIISDIEAEKVEADIIVIAPCSRKSYRKTCIFYI